MITIEVKTEITPEYHEKIEDALVKLLKSMGIAATIENTTTGNTCVVDRGNWMISKRKGRG